MQNGEKNNKRETKIDDDDNMTEKTRDREEWKM